MKTNVLRSISTVCMVLATALGPVAVQAQGGDKDSVQGYLVLITNFIGDTLLPFLFAIALLFFLVNVARYFIAGGNDVESQETAKKLAIYGIGAFVFLVSIWGIVNMLVNALEIDDDQARCPDYLGNWCGSSGNYGSSGGGYQRFGTYYENTSTQVRTNPVETFSNGSQAQSVDIYDRNGNIVDTTKIHLPPTQNVPVVTEPAEEAEVHVDESAPVNIGDTVPSNRSNCTTSPSGIETCDLMQ